MATNSTGTLAQAYPGQTTTLVNAGFAAVLAYRTALDLTGHPSYGNTVDGMSNGILAFNSDLSVARFDLKNVQPDGAYGVPNDANGSGIHVYGRIGHITCAKRAMENKDRPASRTAEGPFTPWA